MIELRGLTKRYGRRVAVDNLSCTIRPGLVTGFLGPNGAGKSTTMRMIVGLSRPSAGTATIDGVPYVTFPDPLRRVGALLEATPAHRGRTAYQHVLALAQTHAIPTRRVREVLALAGLESVAGRRTAGFSLGMRQRLGIAAALLGDPGVLILDEPTNGLDPDGVFWLRTLLRGLAAEGRTVLLSSHLMSEMALTAHHLVVIGRGRLVADISTAELIARAGSERVLVRTDRAADLRRLLESRGADVVVDDGALSVGGLSAAQVGALAYENGVPFHELKPVLPSLEEAYMELTRGAVEFEGSAR